MTTSFLGRGILFVISRRAIYRSVSLVRSPSPGQGSHEKSALLSQKEKVWSLSLVSPGLAAMRPVSLLHTQ